MSDSTSISDEGDLTLRMTRRFKVSREQVFDAWSSLEAMSHWFGPGPCYVQGGKIDFRVGGCYRLDLMTDDLGLIAVAGEYREISRPEKISFSWQWSGNKNLCEKMMEVVIELVETGEKETELRLIQTGFPDRKNALDHGEGWGGSFDKFVPWVAGD